MTETENNAFFITFEGPEGAGKTTQISLLQHYLQSKGLNSVTTREPGGTVVAEQLRDIVKHHTGPEPLTDEAELLLFAASRAQHVRNFVIPSLAANQTVICDRFYDSTTAYQGYARGQDLEFVNELNHYAICGCKPNLTILLDLSPEDGFKRTADRAETKNIDDRIEAESLVFHQAVRDGFLKIAANEPDRVKIVAATGTPDEIHAEVRRYVDELISRV